jgi:ribonuclease HI
LIRDQSGKKIAALREYLGHQTNNFAEYSGLIAALQYALDNGYRALKVVSDSELMVRQMRGQYKVKSPALLDLYRRANELSRQFEWFCIEHVLRHQNREADELANAAMDNGMGRSAGPYRTPSSQPNQGLGRAQEFEGIVRHGVIELNDGSLPDGTIVEVRVKRP